LFRLRQQLEAAAARPRAPEADAETLERSLTELDGVLATFSALLRIGRAEAGVPEGALAPVDLSALAAQVVELYDAVAEEAGQAIQATIQPAQVVTGDAALLRQALANLVENALAHGGPGVRVTVSVEATPGGPLLAVRDTGPGIPELEHERVLQRFYRLDRSRTTPGNGLGLALVAATARLHGAALRLEDAAPGLRVVLAFPPPAGG
jgi:signal transduction histidine kinase